MKFNPKIFKAYDIRGVYGKDFDDELAYQLGLAYGIMRRQEKSGKLKIVVGSDMRLSSPSLKLKLINGLVDSGVDILDIGLSSTPTFYFAVANYNFDGGLLVTASHNPKEYNGFKLVRAKALPISLDTGLGGLRDMIITSDLEKAMIRGRMIRWEDISNVPLKTAQLDHDIKFSNIEKIKPLKIVIDPANAMGSLYFNELFSRLSCHIIKINWNLDGNFPAHEADPFKAENLVELCQRVVVEKADLGISTDGDGDRIFFVDELGQSLDPGITRAILCKIFLTEKPGSKIAYDIRPGRITPDTIIANGGTPIVTKVGHSLIKAQTIEEGAYFAGESSGHFFLNMPEGCYEVPIIVTLKILEELSASGLTLSEYIKPYKKYFHSGEINSTVENINAKMIEIKNKYSDGKLDELDGITIEYPDFWFNVRPSNTEPLLRLNLEATSKELMDEKQDELLALIRN